MSLELVLLGIGILIILVLSVYACHLVLRVRKLKAAQSKREEEAIEAGEESLRKLREELARDIRFLSNSILQEQCEITEGVLRLHYAIERYDPEIWLGVNLSVIRQHHELTKGMPILEAYKALSKKEQLKIDKTRWQLESEHKEKVEQELRWLLEVVAS